jgi:hypothetical protein
MTESEFFNAVSGVLSSGLDADYWTDNALKQNAAYNAAKNDIFARVPGLTLDKITSESWNVICAVAEQAVWLLRHHAEQTTGKKIASESVDGASTTYADITSTSGGDGIVSPRALAYLEQAKAEMKRAAISKIRFVRG